MAYATHCDAPGCDTWQRVESDFAPFLEVSEGEDILGHFCCLDCLMRWAAGMSEPTDVVRC